MSCGVVMPVPSVPTKGQYRPVSLHRRREREETGRAATAKGCDEAAAAHSSQVCSRGAWLPPSTVPRIYV